MSKLRLLAAAEVEYNQAANWYLEQSRKAANRFAAEVEQAIEAICSHPERYHAGTKTTATISWTNFLISSRTATMLNKSPL
jgi:plasmid stabilization system protein ParE